MAPEEIKQALQLAAATWNERQVALLAATGSLIEGAIVVTADDVVRVRRLPIGPA